MPEYLDQFISQLREKKGRIKTQLSTGREGPLDRDLFEMMKANWNALSEPQSEKIDVLAVDGSRALRYFANGTMLYIVRSLAVQGKRRFRDLEVESFLSRSTPKDIEIHVNRKMEFLEFRVALKAIRGEAMENSVILLDGSLHGRMMHYPRDSPAEGQRSFMLQYFETYFELLEECHARGVSLVGVSKDSNAHFLRDHFLSVILAQEIAAIGNKLESGDIRRIKLIFRELHERTLQSVRSFNSLHRKHGEVLDGIREVLREALASRPDHQLIQNCIETPGYTTCLEMGAHGRYARLIEQLKKDPASYVEKDLKESLIEAEDENEFFDYANVVLSKIPGLPTIVSFHVLLDRRDTPLRVDVPSWSLGIEHKLSDLRGYEKAKVDVSRILSVLQNGYGGLRNYNIWLKKADDEVKLKRKTVDELYSSALEKTLDLPIIHTRGYRRVRYP